MGKDGRKSVSGINLGYIEIYFKGNLDKREVKYIISNKLLIFDLEHRECLL